MLDIDALRHKSNLIWCDRLSRSPDPGCSVVWVSEAWPQGCEVGTTLLCCLAVSLGIVARGTIGDRKLVWERHLSKRRMAEHRVQLGVMCIRVLDCEQLVLDVALFREGALRWLRVLLLWLILCASCILSA